MTRARGRSGSFQASQNDLKEVVVLVPSGEAGEGKRERATPTLAEVVPGMTSRNDLSRGDSQQPAINVHGGSRDPKRGSWCTPKWLAEMIGPVDLDPCSNPRSHIQAARSYQLERGQDGLFAAGSELVTDRVFINPPYARDSVLRWFNAYKHTRWCFLLRFDPSTDWFDLIYDAAELVAVPRGRRVNFEPPPGVRGSSNAIAHALYYRYASDVPQAVIRACATWKKKSR